MAKQRFKLIPAVYLFLRRKDEVLLLKRANTGYQDGKYSLVAGHLDGNELAIDGMIREAKEEAGIILKKEDLKFIHVSHRLNRNEPGQERIDLFFEAWQWQGEVTNMEPGKCDEVKWYPINNLPINILPLIRNVAHDILNDVNYSEYKIEPV